MGKNDTSLLRLSLKDIAVRCEGFSELINSLSDTVDIADGPMVAGMLRAMSALLLEVSETYPYSDVDELYPSASKFWDSVIRSYTMGLTVYQSK